MKREPSTHWDRPMTDKELANYYGIAPSSFDVACAVERHVNALDKDDLSQVCQEFAPQILSAIKAHNESALMLVFTNELKATVARSASLGIYGDAFVIKASEISL